MFKKGITIKGEHSFTDYGLYISKRQIGLPTKSSIRKTVPFMNGYYDFTRINGGDTWGERSISYTFDILGDTVEQTDIECTRILNWLGNIHEEDIYDDTMPDYHFHGTFSGATPTESEDGEKVELTVTFVCYPFRIANTETVIEAYRGVRQASIMGQHIRPTIKAITSGRGYYRFYNEPVENNNNFTYPAGTNQLSVPLGAGNYLFGFIPSNQLVYPWVNVSRTVNGITFTANTDGTITVNGTATDAALFYLRGSGEMFTPPVGSYSLVGCPTGGGVNTFRIQIYAHNTTEANSAYFYDNGNGGIAEFDANTDYLSVAIRIAKGYTANNLVFQPQLYGKVRVSWVEEVL